MDAVDNKCAAVVAICGLIAGILFGFQANYAAGAWALIAALWALAYVRKA